MRLRGTGWLFVVVLFFMQAGWAQLTYLSGEFWGRQPMIEAESLQTDAGQLGVGIRFFSARQKDIQFGLGIAYRRIGLRQSAIHGVEAINSFTLASFGGRYLPRRWTLAAGAVAIRLTAGAEVGLNMTWESSPNDFDIEFDLDPNVSAGLLFSGRESIDGILVEVVYRPYEHRMFAHTVGKSWCLRAGFLFF